MSRMGGHLAGKRVMQMTSDRYFIVRDLRRRWLNGELSEEQVARLTQISFPFERKGEKRQARSVLCLETGELYESRGAVARALGVGVDKVKCAVKRGYQLDGFHFYMADEPRPDDAFFKPYYGRLDIIECVETGMCFGSMIEAARYVGVKTGHSIRLAIDNGGQAGGYHWRFKHNETSYPDFKRPLKRGCEIYCAETGEMFDNLTAAAKWLDCDISLIRDAIRRGGTCRGYHWFYADEMEDATQLIFAPDPRLTRVRCVETGEEFASIKSAAEWCGVRPPNLSAVISGKQKRAGGYCWERISGDGSNIEGSNSR